MALQPDSPVADRCRRRPDRVVTALVLGRAVEEEVVAAVVVEGEVAAGEEAAEEAGEEAAVVVAPAEELALAAVELTMAAQSQRSEVPASATPCCGSN